MEANIEYQPLDNKTLSRLETAVTKSSYVGAGKKLKVTNTVRTLPGSSPNPHISSNIPRSTPRSSADLSLRSVTEPSI